MMRRLALILGLLVTSPAIADEPKVLLGVLEHTSCGKPDAVRARVMFTSDGGHWKSLAYLDHDPEPPITGIKWTVALDERVLGTVRLEDAANGSLRPWYQNYSRDRLFVPHGRHPSIANHGAFAGWCEAPSTRPLVLVTGKAVADPSGWKPAPLADEYLNTLYGPMKLVIGRTNVSHCSDDEGRQAKPFAFTATDLKLNQVYRSNTGATLVSIQLKPEKNGCDGPRGSEWSRHWFLLQDGSIDFLGNRLQLVDAGDYDGDGRSELLFWYSGYNDDGYVLVLDDLRRKIDYRWHYH